VLTCPSCGQENPDGFRFCGACGRSLTADTAVARDERKVVTALFCDLVGSTAQAERMDPEDVSALLSHYHARVRAELERFGGTVEKFIGDAVVALFGAPVAHEDDPERAVRAALAIRDWTAGEPDLHVRLAVNTGEALVALGARPEAGEGMASGDVVNTAARLQAAAPVDGILVGEQTYRATRDVIVYGEAEPVSAKGKAEPVPVWVAIEPRSRVGGERGHAARLVGRSEELDVLTAALARVKRERSPQLVTVVGVPGIGKSRLVYELGRSIETHGDLVTWRRGRALPYGEAVTFGALAEIVKAQVEILDSDSAPVAEQKLAAAVAAADPPEAQRVASQLRPLVGLGGAGGSSEERRPEAFAAWRRFFEALAEQRPLVLVLEDLHWADDGVLDFVDHLVEWATGVPILVVCTARPELLTRRPGWAGGKSNATTISLSPLSSVHTAKLLGDVLGRSVLPAETQATLLAAAGGNPLYAEQFARMLAESRTSELELPETVQAIIAARIDALPQAEKALLQDSAVVGGAFWLGAVGAVAGVDTWRAEELLHALERKEFVRREHRSSVAGDGEYSFQHLLVRDVAYGSIPRAARAEKHARAAAWIESLGRAEDQAESVAHHYRSALELARAAGRNLGELEENARRAFRTAGDRAAVLFTYGAAFEFYEQALELWPADHPERGDLLFRRAEAGFHLDRRLDPLSEARDVLLAAGNSERAAEAETLLALAYYSREESGRALEHAACATELVHAAEPSRAKAFVLANQARLLAVTGSEEEAISIGREALALAEELALYDLWANALNTIGMARVGLDDFGGLEDLEGSLRLALEHCSPFELGRIYNNLAFSFAAAGRLPEARETFEIRIANARRLGMHFDALTGAAMLSDFAYVLGDWEATLRLVEELLADPLVSHWHDGALMLRALIRLGRNDLQGAWSDVQRGLEVAVNPDGDWPAYLRAVAVRVALAAGREQDARTLAGELEEILNDVDLYFLVWPHQLFEVAAALDELGLPLDPLATIAAGHPERVWHRAADALARGAILDAAEILASAGAETYAAYFRLRGTQTLVAADRTDEAGVQRERALEFYRSVRATRYLRESEADLKATASPSS
jgi:class 3 adenylate cyclase/tetratricopeptide (TPR) repeat protein